MQDYLMMGGDKIELEGRIKDEILILLVKYKPKLYSSFSKAYEKTAKWEGFWTDNKNDSGGLTFKGISKKFLQDENIDINNDGIVDDNDVLALDSNEVEELYKMFFWKKMKCDKIKAFAIQSQLFDIGVNCGRGTSVKILQKCLNSLGYNLSVDGIIGNKTIDATNKTNYLPLNNLMVDARKKRYYWLAEKYPKNKEFLDGWINRSNDFYI